MLFSEADCIFGAADPLRRLRPSYMMLLREFSGEMRTQIALKRANQRSFAFLNMVNMLGAQYFRPI